jgi:hypothetical protein
MRERLSACFSASIAIGEERVRFGAAASGEDKTSAPNDAKRKNHRDRGSLSVVAALEHHPTPRLNRRVTSDR